MKGKAANTSLDIYISLFEKRNSYFVFALFITVFLFQQNEALKLNITISAIMYNTY